MTDGLRQRLADELEVHIRTSSDPAVPAMVAESVLDTTLELRLGS